MELLGRIPAVVVVHHMVQADAMASQHNLAEGPFRQEFREFHAHPPQSQVLIVPRREGPAKGWEKAKTWAAHTTTSVDRLIRAQRKSRDGLVLVDILAVARWAE